MATTTLTISETKARLSEVVRKIEEEHARFVIKKHGHPVAIISPIGAGTGGLADSALATYANKEKRDLEATAFARAMEEKHASSR